MWLPRWERWSLLPYESSVSTHLTWVTSLVDDPYEHGPKVMDLLQNMEFPNLYGDPLIDEIIDKYWHNQYRTLGDLATHTETLLQELRSEALNPDAAPSTPAWCRGLESFLRRFWYSLGTQRHSDADVPNNGGSCAVDRHSSNEDLPSKQQFCKELERRGLLRLLISSSPVELGFSMEHRHVSNTPAN